MTEVIFALGAGENLVGNTTYCDFPEEAKRVYKVGDFSNPSIERIVSLRPNLVILNLPEQKRIKQELEKLKINFFISSPATIADIYDEIKGLGRITGKEREADSIVNFMKSHIYPLNRKKRRVYIELAPHPLVTIGSESFLNELLEMAGGKNIFSDLKKDYPVVSQEEVIKRNPEIIILLHPEGFSNRIGWDKVAAVKENKVYRNLQQDYILRPGPRLVLGFKELQKIFE